MFGTKVLEKFDSKYSGEVKVMQAWGYKYVATGFWTQSGGIIKELWQPVFKKVKFEKNKTWSILGLSTGTVAKLLPSPAKIFGVEIDPIMIEIGKKYFDLNKIPNLEIICADAQKYHPPADITLVDLYYGDQMPSFVYSDKFLKYLKNLVIINHLYYTPDQKQNAEKLVKKLEKIFTQVELLRSLTNLLIICS